MSRRFKARSATLFCKARKSVLVIFLLALIGPLCAEEILFEPKIIYSVNEFRGYFDTREEALAAYTAYQNAANETRGPGPYGHIHIVGYQVNGVATLNGEPNSYSFTRVDAECPSGCAAGIMSASPECPEGVSSTTTWQGQNRTDKCIIRRDEPQRTCPAPKVGNPIYPSTGTKEEVAIDYAAVGSTLSFVRTYRSDLKRWSHNHEFTASDLSKAPSSEMPRTCEPGKGAHSGRERCFLLIGSSVTDRSLTISRGADRLIAFDNDVGRFPDVNDTIVKKTDGWWVNNASRNSVEAYRESGLLTSSSESSGKSLTYTYSDSNTPNEIAPRSNLLLSVSDSFGRALALRYDSESRLVQMSDPDGKVYTYAYGETGGMPSLLSSVIFPDGRTRQYRYNEVEHVVNASDAYALTGVIDEHGVRYSTFKYANGKAISTEHAGGVDRFILDPAYAKVTDPVSAVRDYDFAMISGQMRMTRQSQPAGAGCAASVRSIEYDTANGNVTGLTDFNGKRKCFAYGSRNLVTAEVEGLEASAACSVVASSATLPTGSRKVSKQWHPDWRLEAKVAEPGRITTSVYNGQPDPLNGNAIASCAPTTALLPDGKRIAVLCKRIEQATTDANGAAGFSATLQSGVVARTWTWTYNEYGQVLTEDGPRTDATDVTTYAYYTDTTADHTKGDLRQVTNAVGKVTQYTKYNKHGQVLESVDPNAVLTVNAYDLRQRLLSTTVGGQMTSYAYDPVGQLKRVTLPDTTYVGYDYDDAHRLVAVYDHLGNRTTYELDNAGNRKSEKTTDPTSQLKRQLGRSIDALGRIQQTTGRE